MGISTMKMVVFLAVATSLCSARSAWQYSGPRPCHREGLSNGCNYVNGRELTPACDRHDVCYTCGARYGLSRLECDQAFHDDLDRLCDRQSVFRRARCHIRRNVFYYTVRWFGTSSYRNPSTNDQCLETWIPFCLPQQSTHH